MLAYGEPVFRLAWGTRAVLRCAVWAGSALAGAILAKVTVLVLLLLVRSWRGWLVLTDAGA